MKKWSKELEEEEESQLDSLEFMHRLSLKDAHKMLKDLYRYNYDEEYPDGEEEE